jgi:hypothetical protein
MKKGLDTAFDTPIDTAFRIAHYAGKLADISNNPSLKGKEWSADYTKLPVGQYAEPSNSIQASKVPETISSLFAVAASQIGSDETANLEARDSLKRSIKTIGKVLALTEPATGPSLSFAALQHCLVLEMDRIQGSIKEMKLALD